MTPEQQGAFDTPDAWALNATRATNVWPELAHICAVNSIKARAYWVLVNGKWVPRSGVMRNA